MLQFVSLCESGAFSAKDKRRGAVLSGRRLIWTVVLR